MNNSWKGDNATYSALHLRVQTARGKASKCSDCGESDKNKRYNWANISGNYTDVMDYKELCVSCHNKMDNKINNITKQKPLINHRKIIDKKSKLCTTH